MHTDKSKHFIFYCANIILPLILGLVIYLVFHKESYITVFISKLFVVPTLSPDIYHGWLYIFVRNFAADILWAYSLTFAVAAVIKYSGRNLYIILAICLGFEIIVEFLQKFNVFHGTFDLLDIVFEAITIVFSLIIIKIFMEAQDEKNSKNT